jgi:hypothetical protein
VALSFAASGLTANDSTGAANESGQTLTVSSVVATLNTHGAVALSSGQITYTPDANYNGAASFDYQVCDNGTTNGATDSKCATGVVNVTVNSVNDNPSASDDSATTDEDTAVTIDVLHNDTDLDGDALTLQSVGNATHGTVSIANNKADFTPDANYHGTGSFTYTVSDGHGGSATATVNVTINSVNDAPVSNNQSATTDEDTAKAITLAASDVDGDTLSFSIVTSPAHGALSGTGANLTYTPAANYNGSDSFTFKTNDGTADSNTATVSITINPVNDSPSAADDSATVNEDSGANTFDVLANDTDLDGDALAVSSVTQGAHGSVAIVAGGVSYTPAHDFNGTDSFTYTTSDSHGGSATAAVHVTINPVNDAPVTVADSATTDEDTPITVDVAANDTDVDGDSLSLASVTDGTHGTVAIVGGKAQYTPSANYHGPDSFTYTVSDGHGGSTEGTVSVTVDSVNDAPVATDDSATTDEDTPVTINVVANDADVDGDTLSLTSVDSAVHGSASIDNGKAVFSPDANYHGTGSFSYTVSDGHGGTATASVTVTINSVNDNPVANTDGATTNEDTVVAVDVRANDTDVDGDAITVSGAGNGSKGTTAVTADGKVRYTPNSNENGADSFTYAISDGHGGTATGTVNVTINPVNDAPVLANVPASADINELAAYTFSATASDVDVPAQALTFSLVGAPSGATIDPATGVFSWTPTEAQGGTGVSYHFKVRVSDGVAVAEANVTINVNEVNQAPTLSLVGNKTVLLGSTLTFTASGADADLPAQALTYSLTGAFPSGASINPATGVFTWTPTVAQAGQTYTFGVRVTDNGPGQLHADETITVGAAYSWSGVLQPINADGSSIFRLGSTIPVKFYLTGASANITNAVARLYVAKVSEGITGSEEEADSTSVATTGNLFRYDAASGQYVFNLGTSGLTHGTYQLRVDTGDGVPRFATISLR